MKKSNLNKGSMIISNLNSNSKRGVNRISTNNNENDLYAKDMLNSDNMMNKPLSNLNRTSSNTLSSEATGNEYDSDDNFLDDDLEDEPDMIENFEKMNGESYQDLYSVNGYGDKSAVINSNNNINSFTSHNVIRSKHHYSNNAFKGKLVHNLNSGNSSLITITGVAPIKKEFHSTPGEEFDSSDNASDNEEEKEKYKAKNREHAKNTRRRKKSYIETLKATLLCISQEQERIDSDRRIALSILAEQMNVRKKVLQTMLQFRAQGEMDINLWRTILDESFIMTLPITPYRSFPPLEVYNNQRKVTGIEAVIADTASFSMMIQSITSCSYSSKNDDIKTKVKVQYVTNPTEMILNDNRLISKILLQSLNAVELGARYELKLHSMVKAIYSPLNKLLSLDLTFDVMNLMQQLRRASGRHTFQVVPNTLLIAMECSSESRIVVEAISPYRVVYVNKNWCDLFGFDPAQVLNVSCGLFIHDINCPSLRTGNKFHLISLNKDSSGKNDNSSGTLNVENHICENLYDQLLHTKNTGRPCFTVVSTTINSQYNDMVNSSVENLSYEEQANLSSSSISSNLSSSNVSSRSNNSSKGSVHNSEKSKKSHYESEKSGNTDTSAASGNSGLKSLESTTNESGSSLHDSNERLDNTGTLQSLPPLDTTTENQVICQAKIYPLYASPDLNVIVTHILMVMDILSDTSPSNNNMNTTIVASKPNQLLHSEEASTTKISINTKANTKNLHTTINTTKNTKPGLTSNLSSNLSNHLSSTNLTTDGIRIGSNYYEKAVSVSQHSSKSGNTTTSGMSSSARSSTINGSTSSINERNNIAAHSLNAPDRLRVDLPNLQYQSNNYANLQADVDNQHNYDTNNPQFVRYYNEDISYFPQSFCTTTSPRSTGSRYTSGTGVGTEHLGHSTRPNTMLSKNLDSMRKSLSPQNFAQEYTYQDLMHHTQLQHVPYYDQMNDMNINNFQSVGVPFIEFNQLPTKSSQPIDLSYGNQYSFTDVTVRRGHDHDILDDYAQSTSQNVNVFANENFMNSSSLISNSNNLTSDMYEISDQDYDNFMNPELWFDKYDRDESYHLE